MSVRLKFLILLLGFAVISLGSVWHAYRVSQTALEERIGRGLERQATGLMDQLDRMMYERYQNVRDWAGHEMMVDTLRSDKEGRISEFLTGIKKEYKLFSDLVYADNVGKIVAASRPQLLGKSIYREPWFQNVIKAQRIQGSDVIRPELLGEYAVIFSAPTPTEVILNKSKLLEAQGREDQNLVETLSAWKPKSLGVLVAFIDWNEVMAFINGMPILDAEEQDFTAYAMLVSRAGIALTQPYFENEAVMFHRDLSEKGVETDRKGKTLSRGFSLEKDLYGKKALLGFAASRGHGDFSGFGWRLLVFQRSSEALAPLKSLQYQILGIGFLFGLLLVLVVFFFTRYLTQPLEKLVVLTQKIARGEFSEKITVKSKDEIGALAASFNEMINGLQKAQSDIIQARDYANDIIQSAVDALFVTDPKGRVRKCNLATGKILGYEEDELLGKPIWDLFPDKSVQVRTLFESVAENPVINIEMEVQTKEGQGIPMLISANPMKNKEGEVIGVVTVAKDISGFKSLEEQFHRAQRMDTVGRLSGGIAHDFNNMLTIINGYSEMLLRKIGKDDPRGGELGLVLKAGHRAARLVQQLLTFSRRQVIKPSIIDLNELVIGMKAMLRHITSETIELVALPGDNVWPIKVDPGQFEQVLANLTVNARDAMPEGGKLVIKTENRKVTTRYANEHDGMKPGEYVVLSVQDSGTGMPEEVKKKIFEPFFTTKEKGKGTGLGLATCYGMVKQAGGYIDVESKMGQGTTFNIFLPRAVGEVQTLQDQTKTTELPTGSERILLTEDEELVRGLTKNILTTQGYQVMEAGNGSEALELVKEKGIDQIDLVITDVVMPKMGGRELSERLKELRPAIKILFMSGYADDDTIHSSVMDESIAFISKPITPYTLAMKVRTVLDGEPAHEA